jgi:glycosyltransferase (activator-dependent family)
MKVMFTCFAHDTHYYTMVPMAWALRNAGHDVRVISQAELTDTITASGLTAVPVSAGGWPATDHRAPELFDRIHQPGTQHVRHFDFTGIDRLQWTWENLLGLEMVMVPALYASMNDDLTIEGTVDFARYWQPDLVVAETYTFAGAVAARVVGAAHARLIWGPDNAGQARRAFLAHAAAQPAEYREDPTGEWLGNVLARYGCQFDEEVLTGHWTIDTTPPSARLCTESRTVGVRYIPYNGPAVVPDFLSAPPQRRRVCLTFGLAERAEGRPVISLAEILDAVADLDVEFVATLNATQLAGVRVVPDNVRVFDFVPLNDLLPTCSVVVHQGGCGTRATAEVHGVPQLMLTDGWDTEVKGIHLERVGAGLCLPMTQLTAARFRDRLVRLLDDASFTRGAQLLREEALAERSPNDAVPLIEELTRKHRSGRTKAA